MYSVVGEGGGVVERTCSSMSDLRFSPREGAAVALAAPMRLEVEATRLRL